MLAARSFSCLWIFPAHRILYFKSIAMTNNEILKADLLDILFEHRNKQYGAYVLRRYYNDRLAKAMGISFSMALVFVLFSFLKKDNKQNNPWDDPDKNAVIVSSIDIPKQVEPEQIKPIEKPKPVASGDFQTIKIVEDDKVKEDLITNNELNNKAISNENVDGEPPADLNKAVVVNSDKETGGEEPPAKKEGPFDPIEVQPSFPGGPAALALFFSRNINPPSDLEAGEKKIVMVKFFVNADGSVTQTEIVQSSGEVYEREVLRAFRKMPKWNPAIQNGHKIAVAFTQPVTFVGSEE